MLGRVLNRARRAEEALPLLDEARDRFQSAGAAQEMASICRKERGDSLKSLGRLDEAAVAYEEHIVAAERLGDVKSVAVAKGQLGTVRLRQRRFPEALAAYAEARKRFAQLNEPGNVASCWHLTGNTYQDAGQPEAAEDAYRNALAIQVQVRDVAGEASTKRRETRCVAIVSDRP